MARTEQKDSLLTKELDLFVEHNVKDILDLHPWMSDKTFRLLTKQKEIEEYIERCIQSGICALDLETTGLNTRIINGKPVINLVGICLACSDKEGIYIPVGHTGYTDNVPLDIAVYMLKILCNSECILIFHNFKYDGEVLRGLGIIIEDENKIEDTLLLAAVDDASRKQKGLKYLSENLVGRPMLEINNLGVESSKKKVAAFSEVSPKKAVIYGGSDAMNTYALFFNLKKSLDQQDPTGSEGPWRVYKRIEKPALFVVMDMERNLVRINVEKLNKIKEEIIDRMKECASNILKLAGREFDINSPKQLGEILFNEMKIKYPLKEKNANGTYSTDVETLELVQKANPIISYILNYRSYQKTLSTYVENFLNNVDRNGEVKFQLNQVQAETGRFSASGGSGYGIDGYCGVNCQNISTYDPDDPTSFDLRDAVEAHDGFVIVAVDYSGEELRIAANLSKEPNWIKEFLQGTGDIHTITARAALGKQDLTKKERGIGKTLNFQTLYGGGPGSFAAKAGITIESAKKLQANFFKANPTLRRWMDDETKITKRRMFSRTALGRRRNLKHFYMADDSYTQSKGDRCAINSAIQGCGADIIKLALYRVWKWINKNGYQNDIKILLPVHDEIVYEMREDKLDFLIPEIVNIMQLRDVTDRLGWEVPLVVDAEYGKTWKVEHDFFKEKAKQEKTKEATPQQPKQDNDSQPEKVVTTYEPAQPQVSGSNEGTVISAQNEVTYNFSISIRDELLKAAPKVTELKEENDPVESATFEGKSLKECVDKEDFFVYTIFKVDFVVSEQFTTVMKLLVYGDSSFIGHKKRIKVKDQDGKIIYTSSTPVSIDAFVALCTWLNL